MVLVLLAQQFLSWPCLPRLGRQRASQSKWSPRRPESSPGMNFCGNFFESLYVLSGKFSNYIVQVRT